MKKGPHYAWLILASCCAIMMVGVGIFNSCAGVYFAPVSKELGVGIGQISVYITIQSLVSMVILPFTGKLFNKFDILILLTSAFVLLAVAFGCMSLANSVIVFYVCGALIGIACAFIIYMPVPILINSWFQKKSGLAMGIATSFAGVGAAVFTPIANALVQNLGWRLAYVALAAIGAVLILPFTIFVVRTKPADKGLAPYGAEENASSKANVTVLEGVATSTALKSVSFWVLAVFAALVIMGSGITTHVPGIAGSFGFSPAMGATAGSALAIGVIAGKLLIGPMSDKFGPTKAVWVNLLAGVVGLFLILFNGGSFVQMLLGSGMLGMATCTGTIAPALITKAAFGTKDYNVIYSYISTVSSLAGAVSISLFGFIYDATNSYIPVLYILVAAFVIAGLAGTVSIISSKRLARTSSEA